MTIKQEILAEAYILLFGTPAEQREALDQLVFLTNALQHETLTEEQKGKQLCMSRH